MMQTNLLRGALKRHALGASARLGGSSCTALRIGRSRGCSGRNLSSVVAVRDDDDGTAAAATAAAVAHVRAAVNGVVKKRGPSLVGKSTKEWQQTSFPSVEDEEIKKNYLNQIHSDEEEHASPTHLKYTGGQSMPLTSKLKIVEPGEDAPRGIWPVYRILVRIKEHWDFYATCTFSFVWSCRYPRMDVVFAYQLLVTDCALLSILLLSHFVTHRMRMDALDVRPMMDMSILRWKRPLQSPHHRQKK